MNHRSRRSIGLGITLVVAAWIAAACTSGATPSPSAGCLVRIRPLRSAGDCPTSQPAPLPGGSDSDGDDHH